MKLLSKSTKGFSAALSVLLFGIAFTVNAAPVSEYYYQFKIYHIKTKTQEERLDRYLKNAYLPALHKAGVNSVGVFKSMEQDTDRRVYVLIPYKSWNALETTDSKLLSNDQYITDGSEYLNSAYNDLPYTRMETIVLRAFPTSPAPAVPQLSANKADRVYELRSYESPTEKYNISKLKMFNDGGETVLFKRLNFNSVFYAEVLAGSHMPNLMYMTTFNNKADRDKHWEAFFADPVWKALVVKEEYQHNVSKAEITFLHPAEYSDY